jgi:nitrite reductase (NADH) small subunit/3-phenylpropionate/trans-cinnamate dioxygenase ferredoxin subunit
MAEFITVARVEEVSEGRPKPIQLGNKLIGIFSDGGRYYAIEDTCPHMGASLSEGTVENGVVTCCWHGWRFRLADGTWVDSPRVKIGSYPVRVMGDEIQVLIEDSGRQAGQ